MELVKPEPGLMVWALITFGITLLVLRKFAFPKIADALERRRREISWAVMVAERTRQEADELLAQYRQRLKEARDEADAVVSRAQEDAGERMAQAKQEAREEHEQRLEETRREIEEQTRQAVEGIRSEIAGMAVLATEKVTRKPLEGQEERRLAEEALAEIDLSGLPGGPEDGGGAGRAEDGAGQEAAGRGEGGADREGGG
ncbi:MAG: F0F1 ATP synthase subunit B [Actinomycetota bacterium]|nr:F0F1 ATP synthase subunit B [Actinomycetota bacterium]